MKKYTSILLLVLLAACHGRPHHAAKAQNIDAVRPVYRLATNVIAVLFTDNDSASVFRKAFTEAAISDSFAYTATGALPRNCSWVDTSGPFRLFTSATAQKIAANALKDSCYIYGSKGVDICSAKRLLFSFDECRENIYGFEVTGYDSNRCGNPLFYSPYYIPVDYLGSLKKVQSKVAKLVASEQNDYRNQLNTILFAKLDSFYLGYEDDFTWQRAEHDTICLLPSRCIFVHHHNGDVRRKWTHDIDMIGIPCD